ncbi:MAG: hypothetical protein ACOVNY_08810, partial [Chitinophagaceae bacterium]
MERVGILINRLQEQFFANTPHEQLAITAQMLLNELKVENNIAHCSKKVSVTMPFMHTSTVVDLTTESTSISEPLQLVETALINEVVTTVEDEPEVPFTIENFDTLINNSMDEEVEQSTSFEEQYIEEIAPIAESSNTFFETAFKYDYSTDNLPTLMHQKPKEVYVLNDVLMEEESVSVHTQFKEHKPEIATVLESAPIKDLKKAISINDRYVFIQELFRGDEAMFERSLKTINGFSILPEAFF